MFAVGLILIILAIIVVVYVIFATRELDPMSIDWGVFTADLTPLQLFFLGAVTILVLAIGSVLLSIGLKSQGEKRAEVKRLRKEVKQSHGDEGDKGTQAPHSTPDSSPDRADTSPTSSSEAHPGARTERDETGRGAAGNNDGGSDSVGRDSAGSAAGHDGGTGSSAPGPSHTPTTKLPPPVPPRDSTPPPSRSPEL